MISGVKLRALRKASGKGLREVAYRVGTSPSTLSRAERGHIDLPARLIVDLAVFYQVPPQSIMSGPQTASNPDKARQAQLRLYAEQLSAVVNQLLDIVAGLDKL